MNIDWQLLAALVLIVLSTTIGGLWIARHRSSDFVTHKLPLLIAIGTGMLIMLNFVEFLPHAYATGNSWVSGFVLLGILSVIATEKYISPLLDFLEPAGCQHDHHTHSSDFHHKIPAAKHAHHLISHQAACSSIGCLLVCAFFDGVQIKSAFSLDAQTGWLVSLGLLFHILPDGALSAGMALAGGFSYRFAKISAYVTGGVVLAGALVSFIIESLVGYETVVLPFASGVLMYVSFVHLMPIATRSRHGFFFMLGGALFIFVMSFFHSHDHSHVGHTHAVEAPAQASENAPAVTDQAASGEKQEDKKSDHPHGHSHSHSH